MSERERDTEPITTVAEARRYQGKHWREDIAILDSELGGSGSMNYVRASVHSSRHGTEGYDVYFSGPYLFKRATKAIRSLGFEIVSMSTETYRDNADFKILIRRTRPAMIQELRRADTDEEVSD